MPLILLTNDDGIQSPGLSALASALAGLGDVVTVAPSQQQSAVSQKITLSRPLRATQLAAGRWTVNGTPTDAIFLALHKICGHRPDLVVSGINLGLNLGMDLYYSGTLAGAREAAIQGVPAFAVSQQLPTTEIAPEEADPTSAPTTALDPTAAFANIGSQLNGHLERTAEFAAAFAERFLAAPKTGRLFNINAPNGPAAGYAWTQVGQRGYRSSVLERLDPRGVPYYWISGPVCVADEPEGTDARAIADGLMSVSAVSMDCNRATFSPPDWQLDGYAKQRDDD